LGNGSTVGEVAQDDRPVRNVSFGAETASDSSENESDSDFVPSEGTVEQVRSSKKIVSRAVYKNVVPDISNKDKVVAVGDVYGRDDNSYIRRYADPVLMRPKAKTLCNQHGCSTKIKAEAVCGECAVGPIQLNVGFCDEHVDHDACAHDEMFEEYGLWVNLLTRSNPLQLAFGLEDAEAIRCTARLCHRCRICPSTFMRAGAEDLEGLALAVVLRDLKEDGQ
jgi:hypothetical protein